MDRAAPRTDAHIVRYGVQHQDVLLVAERKKRGHCPKAAAALTRSDSVPSVPPELIAYRPMRYSERPTDWRSRLCGMGGTALVFLLIAAATLVTWRVVQPIVAEPAPLLVVDLQPLSAPPEPVKEVPEGPEQVEQEEQKPKEQEDRPAPPEITIQELSPITLPTPPPVEALRAADPVPETTAPKSIPAPPANRAASKAEATWEAMLLAHLEQYRRYPASARARRLEGTAYVWFRMNREGKVLASEIARSSGSAVLDRAALATIRRAQPLPAIPDDRPDPLELSVPVEFFVSR